MKISLRYKLQLFAWKQIREILHKRSKVKNLGINIDGICPFCNEEDETLSQLLGTCDLGINDWSTIETHCPNPINSSLKITD